VDSEGKVVHPRALLRAKGFDLGATVDAEGRAPHRIVAVGRDQQKGAQVILETVAASSPKQITVLMDVFLAKWSLCDLKKFVEKHPGWPDCYTGSLLSTAQTFQKGMVLAALGSLSRHLDKHHPIRAKIDVLSKPTRKVIATVDICVGGLVLAPVTQGLKAFARADLDERRADPPTGGVEVTFQPADEQTAYWLTPSTASDNVSPLFCVGTTTEPTEATMEWRKYVVQQVCGVDFVGRPAPAEPPAKRVRLASKTDLKEPDDEGDNTYISIPVLINTVPLAAGDELLYYKEAVVKPTKGPTSITIADLSKRARRVEVSNP
jgi:hypothetical protein